MEILNQIKELELRAGKYDSLKECFENEIPKVNKLILDVESKLSDIRLVLKNINPILSLESVSGAKRMNLKPIIERIYNDMVENDAQISTEDLINKYGLTKNQRGWVIIKLREMSGVKTRIEGRRIYLYYFKGTGSKDEIKLDETTSIPKKFNVMR